MHTCKLVIQDEVNCKLEGLPVEIRRKLSNKFKYIDPVAKYQPAFKLGRWDGSIAFFGIGGNGYVAHLPQILEILEENDVEITDFLDERKPIKLVFPHITTDFWGDTRWPEGHPKAGELIRLREDQVEALNLFAQNPQCIQELCTSFGKCQPLTSKVLTPSGFVNMGDISVGDTVVTPDGTHATVLNTYHPGVKDVYEITFVDGRKVRACEDHMWKIHNHEWRGTKTGIWRNISTAEIKELLPKVKRGLKIPLVSFNNDTPNIDLPIDPWLMGFLLGDGCFRNGRITLSTADNEIVERISSILDDNYKLDYLENYDYCIKFKNNDVLSSERVKFLTERAIGSSPYSFHKYVKSLMDVGLMETTSDTKFIPSVYFNGGYEQRIEIIRGLMDSDGTTNNGGISFTTCSKQLASDMAKMIWSIGGITNIYTKRPTYTNNGEKKIGKEAYEVYIRFPRPWELFSLTRKKDKTGYKYNYENRLNLKISDVSLVSHEEVKCIMIDHPDHLYITDNYVVTHNTVTTATMVKVCEPFGRTLTIVPNKSLVEQTEEDFANCSLDVGVYYGDRKELNKTHTICTWQSLGVLDKKTKGVTNDDILTLSKFIEGINAVIVDEVHQAKADVLRRLLTQNLRHIPIRWGLTGTIPKEDFNQQSLLTSLGPVVNTVKANELQEKGILSSCHIHIMQMIDTVAFSKYPDELKYLVTNYERVKFMASMIEAIADTNTLVLVTRIDTGEMLQSMIPGSVFISGAVKTKDRKEEYDTFKTENSKILIATAGVAAVGINIVSLYNLVMIEPGKSFVRVIQSIGRGLRKGFGKEHVDIWDFTSTCKFSKRHLTERKRYYNDAHYKFSIKKIDWR